AVRHRGGPAFGSTEPRQQLAHPEGLRHVIVRPRVEGGHLLRFLLAGREHDDGDRRPRPQPADDLDPVDPRQAEIHDHDVRSVTSGEVERGLTVSGRGHVVPTRHEVRPKAAEDLRLVVDHEDPCHGAASNPITIVSPPPGVSSTVSSPSIASTNPFATASPSPPPLPFRRSPRRWNGRNLRFRCPGGTTGTTASPR